MVCVTECGQITDAPGFHGMRPVQNSAGRAGACLEWLGGSPVEFQICWKSVRLISAPCPCRFSKEILLDVFLASIFLTFFSRIFVMFCCVSDGCFFWYGEHDKIRNASSAAVSPVTPMSPLSYIIIYLENVCFIEVKRYISERLLSGGVFG
jgi:hypothetical protein